MTDKVTFLENDKVDEHIQIIMRQTDYNFETAKQKLEECNYDYLTVIKRYVGVTEKNEPQIRSVNQEIYKQIRHKLDASMREYNERKENK